MQLVLPVVSFLVFMAMPAGKKLFVITSLVVSIILTSYRGIKYKFSIYKDKKIKELEAKEKGEIPEEKIVVETK